MNNSQTPLTEEPLVSPATLLRYFRYLGWAEGASLIILMLIAMPMKYMFGIPQATRIVGSIHGFLFVAYVLFAFQIAFALQWNKMLLLKALIGSVFPFGTFVFDWKYLAKHQSAKG